MSEETKLIVEIGEMDDFNEMDENLFEDDYASDTKKKFSWQKCYSVLRFAIPAAASVATAILVGMRTSVMRRGFCVGFEVLAAPIVFLILYRLMERFKPRKKHTKKHLPKNCQRNMKLFNLAEGTETSIEQERRVKVGMSWAVCIYPFFKILLPLAVTIVAAVLIASEVEPVQGAYISAEMLTVPLVFITLYNFLDTLYPGKDKKKPSKPDSVKMFNLKNGECTVLEMPDDEKKPWYVKSYPLLKNLGILLVIIVVILLNRLKSAVQREWFYIGAEVLLAPIVFWILYHVLEFLHPSKD